MIRIDNLGIHIPSGHSLYIINKFLTKNGEVSFQDFKNECITQISNIIGKNEIDDDILREAFDKGINRLKFLLERRQRLLHCTGDIIKYEYEKGNEYRNIFPRMYGYQDYAEGRIRKCEIDKSECIKLVDGLLSTGKVYSTQALYQELEKEYCWIEFSVDKNDITEKKPKKSRKKKSEKEEHKIWISELYRKCYSNALKQCLSQIDEYLIVGDMDEMLIRSPCFYYKKQYYYHYGVAGTTVLNEQGELPMLNSLDKLKIHTTKYLRDEIYGHNRRRKRTIIENNYLSITEINNIAERFKGIVDDIKEKQIAAAVKINMNIISEICTRKSKNWQKRYIDFLDKTREEFKDYEGDSQSLTYSDLLFNYAQFLTEYGCEPGTDKNRDEWFNTICGFYDEILEIAEKYNSKERIARYMIKYANFLRAQCEYGKIGERYSEAIKIYEEYIIHVKNSIELNQDYAYALRSYSKFLSDYDRTADAIEILEKSLEYIDPTDTNTIADIHIQLSIQYVESADIKSADEELKKALDIYKIMSKYDGNYYADIANIYIRRLRIYIESVKNEHNSRERLRNVENKCLEYVSKYDGLIGKNSNKHDKIFAHALTSLSLFYYYIGEQKNAINSCNKALDIYKKHNGKYDVNIISQHLFLGRALSMPAIERNKEDLDESEKKIKLAHDFYAQKKEENGDIPALIKGLADTNLALAEVYDYRGEIKNASDRYKISIELYTQLNENKQANGKYKELLNKANGLLYLLKAE